MRIILILFMLIGLFCVGNAEALAECNSTVNIDSGARRSSLLDMYTVSYHSTCEGMELCFPAGHTNSSGLPYCHFLEGSSASDFEIIDPGLLLTRSGKHIYYGFLEMPELDGTKSLEIYENSANELYIINNGSVFKLIRLDTSQVPNLWDFNLDIDAMPYYLDKLTTIPTPDVFKGIVKRYPATDKELKFLAYSYYTDGDSLYYFISRDVEHSYSDEPFQFFIDEDRHDMHDMGELVKVEGLTAANIKSLTYEGLHWFIFLGFDLRNIDIASYEFLNTYYQKDAHSVYSQCAPLSGADPATFSVLDGEYAKDAQRVYCNGRVLADADVATFFVMENGAYGRDKEHMYFFDTRLDGVDADSVVFWDNGMMFKDKNNIYYNGKKVFPGADPASFEIEDWFAKDKNTVWYLESMKSLKGFVAKNFKPLGKGYVSDGRLVFYLDMQIENADAPSFQVLGKGTYAKDRNQVYAKGKLVKGADAETFELIGNGVWADGIASDEHDYARDQNNVYFLDYYDEVKAVENVDVGTFTVINNYWLKDKNKVMSRHMHEKFLDADPATFEIIDNEFTRDKKHLYRHGNLIEEADPGSFTRIDERIFKDKHNVFLNLIHIAGADPDSFDVLSSAYSKDKKAVYYQGLLVESADPDTFKVIDHPYSGQMYGSDGQHVFFKDKVIKGAYPDSFKVIGAGYAADKGGFFLEDARAASLPYINQLPPAYKF